MHSMTLYVNIYIYMIIKLYTVIFKYTYGIAFFKSIMETIFLQVQPLPYSGVVSANIW